MSSHPGIRDFEGKRPRLGEAVWVDPSAVVIGDVVLGNHTSVWPCTVIRGDIHSIRVGDRCSIQDGTVVHVTHAGPYNPDGYGVVLGDDVTVGHRVTLHGCTLGSRILVGMGSQVMDGAVVEDEVVIGAGALVTPGKHLASGYLYMGSPARQVRALSEKERNYFRYTADYYVRLGERHLAENHVR